MNTIEPNNIDKTEPKVDRVLLIRASSCTDEQKAELLKFLRENKIPNTIYPVEWATSCPLCHQWLESRKVALFNGMVQALAKVFKYCEDKKEFTFTTKEIKTKLLEPLGTNVTARFWDWDLFGGLVYRNTKIAKKWAYGFNIDRTRDFLNNNLAIPTILELYKNGEEMKKTQYRKISEIPKLAELLDENWVYIAY